jgi:hypothetical protein
MRRGRQTLGQIIKATKQTPKQVKESLGVLIQHRIITFAESFEKGRKFVFYQVNVMNILLRERFPKYIHHIRKEIGMNVLQVD